ncbi:class I SAM-dependent methyltransferase [Nesterenkonia halobia]|uniref:Class I SAM-dependent methyltransferase n=1 Tax=Nesterenkonia halobia TaxID=37922 RepID=A0ABP6R7N4_9MICC
MDRAAGVRHVWTVDDPTAEAAEERLVEILNDGCLGLMLALGHRTGLLAVLAQASTPPTAAELAASAGLQERYVREWLGAMAVGRLVAHDPQTGRYRLPAAHADLLTDEGDANVAAFAQYLAVLAGVEDELVGCFRHGGGVPYSSYPRFQEVMEADSAQTVVAALLDDVLPMVPGLAGRLTAGIDVLDVGCGRGRALAVLARQFPRSRFHGLDLSQEAIDHLRAEHADLPSLEGRVGDAAVLPAPWGAQSFDLVTTFDAIHDQADPLAVVRGIREALRPDGVYLAQDINTSGTHAGDLDHPLGPFIYTISTMHCLTVSLARGGTGLGAAWGRPAAEALLAESGFSSVSTHLLPHDAQNAWYVAWP